MDHRALGWILHNSLSIHTHTYNTYTQNIKERRLWLQRLNKTRADNGACIYVYVVYVEKKVYVCVCVLIMKSGGLGTARRSTPRAHSAIAQ